jgi:dodecin
VSVAKTIILSAQSDSGFEAAIREAIDKANQSLRNIEGAWVKDQNVIIKDGKIVAFRVHLEVTFVLD